MQPYFFPYIGYFQLIDSVDKFIFYDDVNYIKGGWINRNKILSNNDFSYFTIPIEGLSSFINIKDTKVKKDLPWKIKLLRTIENTYRRAPFFQEIFPIIEIVINSDFDYISQFAIKSITSILEYLGIRKEIELSSIKYNSDSLFGEDRLISICKQNNATDYINPSGGVNLYVKENFLKENINLHFIKNEIISYNQFNSSFISGLSIIDILMFNKKEDILNIHLKSYSLL